MHGSAFRECELWIVLETKYAYGNRCKRQTFIATHHVVFACSPLDSLMVGPYLFHTLHDIVFNSRYTLGSLCSRIYRVPYSIATISDYLMNVVTSCRPAS